MAGETAVVYETSVSRRREEPNGPVATAWLLCLWIIGTSAAAGGLTWTWLVPPRWLSSGIVLATAVMIGGPLFLVSWAYLAEARCFRHRPFFLLMGLSLLTGAAPLVPIARDERMLPLALAALPLASCLAMIWVVLGIRLGQGSAIVRTDVAPNR